MYLKELGLSFHILALKTVGELLALSQVSEILLKSRDVRKFILDILANRKLLENVSLVPQPC